MYMYVSFTSLSAVDPSIMSSVLSFFLSFFNYSNLIFSQLVGASKNWHVLISLQLLGASKNWRVLEIVLLLEKNTTDFSLINSTSFLFSTWILIFQCVFIYW